MNKLKKFGLVIGLTFSLLMIFNIQKTSADTVKATPYSGMIFSKTIPYYVQASTSKYKNIWTKALKEFDNNGTVKFKKTKRSSAYLLLSSRALKKKKLNSPRSIYLNARELSGSYVYLNRTNINKYKYSQSELVGIATSGIAYGLGLDYNSNSDSILYNKQTNKSINKHLSQGDKEGLANAYSDKENKFSSLKNKY